MHYLIFVLAMASPFILSGCGEGEQDSADTADTGEEITAEDTSVE